MILRRMTEHVKVLSVAIEVGSFAQTRLRFNPCPPVQEPVT